MKTRLAGLLLLLATGAGAAGPGATAEEFLDWLVRRRDDVGLAAFVTDGPGAAVLHHADDLFPLASVRKVLVLGAYADAVAEGELDPAELVPLATIERWTWPGTDGGAHRSAVEDLRRSGRIVRSAGEESIRLDDVAFAAVRWSDNAAADLLFDRLGGARIDAFAVRHGLERQQPIAPIVGELRLWTTLDAASWAALTPADRARRARAAAAPDVAAERAFRGYAGFAAHAEASFAGTPREWAKLMATVFAAGSDDPALAIVGRHLEWPLLAHPEMRRDLLRLGAKPGAITGVRTEVVYVEPRDGRPLAAALFLRRLGRDEDEILGRTFGDQRFLLRLATDGGFLDRVRSALSRAASAPAR